MQGENFSIGLSIRTRFKFLLSLQRFCWNLYYGGNGNDNNKTVNIKFHCIPAKCLGNFTVLSHLFLDLLSRCGYVLCESSMPPETKRKHALRIDMDNEMSERKMAHYTETKERKKNYNTQREQELFCVTVTLQCPLINHAVIFQGIFKGFLANIWISLLVIEHDRGHLKGALWYIVCIWKKICM